MLHWALLAAICCIDALKMAVFAAFNAFDWERMEVKILAMCVLINLMMVLVVTLSETLSWVVRPVK